MAKVELKEVDIKKIKPNPKQPRERFDKEKLNQLTNSIKQVGLVQPIVIEEKERGSYEIISGERRWKAHGKANIKKILSLVKKYDEDLQKKKELLASNQHRENLADFEEWSYIKAIAKSENLVHEKSGGNYKQGDLHLPAIAALTGTDYNRLLMLYKTYEGTVKEIQKAVQKGKIGMWDASQLSSLDKDEQRRLAKKALSTDEGMKRSEIRSSIKEIKADKIKEEYGIESLKLERTEQDVVSDILTDLSKFEEHFNELKQRGLGMFDNSSLRRIATSMIVKFSNISQLFDYGIKPDKKFLKLVKYGKKIS